MTAEHKAQGPADNVSAESTELQDSAVLSRSTTCRRRAFGEKGDCERTAECVSRLSENVSLLNVLHRARVWAGCS